MEKKVFSPEEEAAEKITTTMASAHTGVRSPDVHDDPQSSTVARAGQAASAEARQQARGMAGTLHEVRQGKRVRLPHPEDQESVTYHCVHQGETLATIVPHFSANANPYPRICAPHRDVMRDAKLRFPG